MSRILWLTNIPSPYRVLFFNKLGEKCELTVLFERKTSSERDNSWANYKIETFNAVFLNGIKRGVDNAICPNVLRYLNPHKFDFIVVTNYSDLTGMLAVIYMKIMHIPYWVEGDGAFVGTGKGPKEKLKKFLLKNAKGYFSTCEQHDIYYLKYGALKEKIVRYPFSSIPEKKILNYAGRIEERKSIRTKIGVDDDKFVVLFVGSFINRKGINLVLQIFNILQGKRDDIVFLLVGGTLDTIQESSISEEYKENIVVKDFLIGEELEEVYKAADIFLLPTREDIWGLVVNEAMSYGLPVITTDRCNAGLELIENGENGFVTPVDDIDTMVLSIEKIIDMLKLDNIKLKSSIFDSVRNYTIEKMVEKHLEIFNKGE